MNETKLKKWVIPKLKVLSVQKTDGKFPGGIEVCVLFPSGVTHSVSSHQTVCNVTSGQVSGTGAHISSVGVKLGPGGGPS